MSVFIGYRRCVIACLLALLPALSLQAQTTREITLQQASERLLQSSPSLQLFQYRLKSLRGKALSADQSPAYELGLEAGNIAGSGNYSGTDSAEYSLSLSSVFELGDKRRERVTLASAHYQQGQLEKEAAVIDQLATLTQRFITALIIQEKQQLAHKASQLSRTSVQLVAQRVERGAAPEAELLRAKAWQAQAQLTEDGLQAELRSQLQSLASLWGDTQADFSAASGNLYQLPAVKNFDELYQRISQSTIMQLSRSTARIREAELQLAQSRSSADIQWSLAATHFADSSDTALTASISLPLSATSRNRGALQSARAELASTDNHRRITELQLYTRLYQAWQQQKQSTRKARQMSNQVIPALQQALEATRKAYERGRYSYSEWVSARQELLNARQTRINAAGEALLNQALIEQLTGMPLTAQEKR